MRRIAVVLLPALSSVACGPPAEKLESPDSATSKPGVECHEVDTSVPPEITSYEEGGIEVHTFMAPDVSTGTATHIVETADGLVVVDTQLFRGYARQFHDYAQGLGKPITHVFVSHGHPDHYFGLEVFGEYPTYALADTHEHMATRGKFHLRMHREIEGECDAVTDTVPVVANVLEPGEQEIGGVKFVFEQVERAEDNTQLVIHVPAAKTLILQDMMAGGFHAFTGGDMNEHWVQALEGYAERTEYTHILAGHGRPGGPERIPDMIAYVNKSDEILSTAQSPEALESAFREAYPDHGGFFLIELMAKLKFSAQ